MIEDGSRMEVTIALLGNPNCGKTTILNKLTGSRDSVGNYPRVTVTPRERVVNYQEWAITIVDLPGVYSLTSQSPEERASRDFIHFETPDIIINILDSGNIDRSLFLTTQLIEMDVPRIHVFNMADEARNKGIGFDLEALSSLLGGPVIETVGRSGDGLDVLLDTVMELAQVGLLQPHVAIGYDHHLEEAIARTHTVVRKLHPGQLSERQCRWLAIKMLEGDDDILMREGEHPELLAFVAAERANFSHHHGEDCEHALAAGRYGFIRGMLAEARTVDAPKSARGWEADDLLLHRLLGLPILLFLTWTMFQATFTFGAYPAAWIKDGMDFLSQGIGGMLPDSMIRSLIVDGIMAGVGGTVVFLPNVVILFFFLALFNETGYIARAAFLLDRMMHLFGLHGKALIPLIMGYGCNVPAIMATRTIESERSRIVTALVTPFMCCSARLPLLMLFAGAFFAENAGSVVFGMYGLSIATALGSAVILSKTVLRAKSEPFVMELPPYRIPTGRAVIFHMWENAAGFLQKVGSVILVGSVVIWFLQSFPKDIPFSVNYEAARAVAAQMDDVDARQAETVRLDRAEQREKLEGSYLGRIGIAASPAFAPLGFNWKDTVAIITGVVAKEVVVASYGVLFAEEKGSEGLQVAIGNSMDPVRAVAFMVFALLYAPCLSTVGALRRETGTWRWPLVCIGYSFVLAWGLAWGIVVVGGVIMP